MGWHRLDRRFAEVLCEAAQPRQAVHRNARHFTRELPAEELHAGLPHPRELLRSAGADLQRLIVISERHEAANPESRTQTIPAVWIPDPRASRVSRNDEKRRGLDAHFVGKV